MDASDGTDSGWQQKGSWTPSAVVPPGPLSVTPSSGSGSSQTFSFLFSDPNGYSAMSPVSVIINTTLLGARSVLRPVLPSSNTLYLANDSGTGWTGPVTLGQSGTLQNSQCTVNTAASSASGSGNNLTLNLALSFQPAFGGAKNIYMDAYDGRIPVGSRKAPGRWRRDLAPVSVTPSSGSGSSQTFSFLFSDPNGYSGLAVMVMINNTLAWPAGCTFLYHPRQYPLLGQRFRHRLDGTGNFRAERDYTEQPVHGECRGFVRLRQWQQPDPVRRVEFPARIQWS